MTQNERQEIEIKNAKGKLLYVIHEPSWANAAYDDYYGIWIQKANGEGMLVNFDAFLECLNKFYKDNF